MENNTGKVREFCQSRKVGTMLIVIQIRELKFIELRYTGLVAPDTVVDSKYGLWH